MDFKESDLYPPVCEYFTALGYDVQAEVNSCDLVAKKDNETVIAELKKSFCLKLVYQAMERQSMTNLVYVVIPRPKKGAKSPEWRHMLKLMKKLDIGIITVAMDSPLKAVDIVSVPEGHSMPKNYNKKAALNKETAGRSLRTNTGGVTKTKIMTAYREKSIYILCLAERLGQIKPADVNKLLGETTVGSIVWKNFYGWFEKLSKGIYGVSDKGRKVLDGEDYREAVDFYRQKAEELIGK